MKIFCGEKDIDYSCPNKYAFLNWRFDNSMGGNNKDNPFQPISDNFEMGKAYMANAVLGLYSIEYNKNFASVSDTLIFPVLFNIWHGIELWLKSGINAIYCITESPNQLKNNHDIYQYIDIFKKELKKMNMNQTIEIALSEVDFLIGEFKRVDAHFDFARYSFDTKGEYQFYNAPAGDDKQWQRNLASHNHNIVPNTCVNLENLWNIVLGVVVNFRDIVEYLTLAITEGKEPTDKNYKAYLTQCKKFEEMLDSDKEKITDPLKAIMDYIFLHVL